MMFKLKLIWENLFGFIMCKRKRIKRFEVVVVGGERKPDAHEVFFFIKKSFFFSVY